MTISAGASRRSAPILAAILHELANRTTWTTIADVADALKTEAARLHVPYTAEAVTNAIAYVSLTRDLLTPNRPAPTPAPDVPHDPPAAEARAILADLRRRLGQAPAIKTIRPGRLITRAKADQLKAAAIVLREIEDTAARCDALEHQRATEEDHGQDR